MKLPLKLTKGTKDRLSTIKGGKYSFELKGYGYDLESELKAAEFIVEACNNYEALKSENAKLQESNSQMAELLKEELQAYREIVSKGDGHKFEVNVYDCETQILEIERVLTAAGHKI